MFYLIAWPYPEGPGAVYEFLWHMLIKLGVHLPV